MKRAHLVRLQREKRLKLAQEGQPVRGLADVLPIGSAAPSPPPADLMRLFAEKYYTWLETTHHSDQTVEGKKWHLEKFFEWCNLRSIERLSEITAGIIEAYQKHIFHYRNPRSGRHLCITSQRAMLAAVRVFFEWLIRKRFLSTSPASIIDLPRVPFKLPKGVMSLPEITRLMDEIDVTTPLGLRDRTISEVLYSSGLRRKEVRALKVRDIDPERGLVRVMMGKGKRERIVPIGSRAVEWYTRYLAESRPRLLGARVDSEFLFLTCHGKQISAMQFTNIARALIEAASITKGGACYAFRHSFATHLLDNDTDLRFIQAMLGHKNIESTTIYTHVALKKLKEVHSAKHPMGKPPGRKRVVK